MSKSTSIAAFKNYPQNIELEGRKYKVREMTLADGDAIMQFARGLPPHDLLYMRRDLTQESGIQRWLSGLKEGRIHSVIAENADGQMIGYSTIHQDDLDWTRHVANLRVTVSPSERGTGLGRFLIREAFNIALSLGVERVTAHMTTDQIPSRNLFHELGFQNEALMKDHIKDRDNQIHDLLIMAVNVQQFLATRDAYGVSN